MKKETKEAIKCWLGLHEYSEWGDPYMHEGVMFYVEYQKKRCKCCGYIIERRLK